ncbi:putative late blight resistance protein homolog R1A-3 isoform X1 [Nicotiana sylvestris]|uniref:Late blight resistance protein homolog R1A-3 isoform X1 n=2 Tax=Nicotiana sylvestris TaxID=4096 RepID=A0A1U7YN72_NICSY|nr:PREDICTED: putative late blight resistance protein homolog R1A-3 isoform X1 [Nicotiana sylvestris]XP_009803438.1 PREDICTED: putative late blight resistance protein homolog R1A-3 isoform X1 [Nicotiana sylvestris]
MDQKLKIQNRKEKSQGRQRNYLHEVAQNDIEDMLDHLRSIKRGGDLNVVKIETLEMELRFLRTFLEYHHVLLPDSLVNIAKKVQLVGEMIQSVFADGCKTNLNVERLASHFLKFIEGKTSSRFNYELDDSYLLEYMDYLDKNLNDAPRYLVKSDPFLRKGLKILQKTDRFLKQVKFLQKTMRFLRYLYGTEINGHIDREKQKRLEIQMQLVADNVIQFCVALWTNEIDGNNASNIENKPSYLICLVRLVELEMKTIFRGELKASKFSHSRTFRTRKLPKGFSHHLHSLLVYLREKKLGNFPNNASARNTDVAIEYLLDSLGDVSNSATNCKMLNEVLEKVGALVGDILCVIHSSTIKDDTSKMVLWSIQILMKTANLKAQVLERYYKLLKFTPSQFPTAGGLSFLDSLLRKLTEMLKSESGLDLKMKSRIVILEKELSSLISVFRDVTKVQHEHDILKDHRQRTINLAYEAEIAIDSILVQYNALWHSFCSLPTIIKEMKLIRTEVTKMWSENLALRPSSAVEPSKHPPTQHSNLMNDEEIVGFENDTKTIIRYLTQGTNDLDVIPIVGMGGQGKTTCARKLYNNNIIASHFDVRAWCVISQTYNRRQLLQEIFSQITGFKDNGDKDDVLADLLKRNLTGKRYLIVLDDMWDGMAWDDLRLSFPVGNRSRIVVTTRLEKMGEHVKHHTDPYFLPFLTAEESCQLLQKKVFQQESCPQELQDVSQAVAKRCKGLPLVVVLAAGIIKKKKMEESWWHEVEKALLFYLDRESEDYSRATMQLSYDNLPDYLRPCLLYMGMFPEDARIPASKLISLWIAEGFVQNVESGRLMEEAAEDYLKDLISSNVVMVSRRRYNGKVKYCQVHDVVLHFCLERSRKEKFILAMKVHYTQFQPSYWNETRLSFNFTNELSEFALLNSKTRKPFHQKLRSLKTTYTYFHQLVDWDPLRQCTQLRLLKVLDLSSNKVVPLSSATLEPLIHLKYLAVVVEQFDFHPKSHLPHLETLIVRYNSGDTVLPATFWKMEKLRHVEISHAIIDDDLEDNKQRMFQESSKLENLRILRKVIIKDAANEDALIQRCPNLQELGISYERSRDICHKLESLTQLQILHLFFDSSLVVSKLHLPSNLKKLVLKGTRIESTISFISELSSLEYLQLHSSMFMKSEEWCLGDITFHKLKFLKLVDLGIVRWNASEESFPQLETLVIKVCYDLEEIPLSFADIPTLKQIKLMWCSKSLVASAVRIKEAVQDIEGCDRINISIDE